MKLEAELIGYAFASFCISGAMALFSYPCLYEAVKGREIDGVEKIRSYQQNYFWSGWNFLKSCRSRT